MKLPLWLRWRSDAELNDEIQTHLELELQSNLDRGMSREEALLAAIRAFGNPARVREMVRDADPLTAIYDLIQDIYYALRVWRKNVGFALAAVVAMGLGIGVNAAVFIIANAVLFKTLAYEGTGHIVYVQGTQPGCEFPCDVGRSYPDFREFQAQAHSFEEMMAYSLQPVNLSDSSSLPERYRAMLISANGFSVFGQKPVIGRDFVAEDEQLGATPVAMLTYPLWQTRYGGDPSIVGKSIRVNEVKTTVIGVMPSAMQFRVSVDLWIPLVPADKWQKREYRGAQILGRLAKSATLASARVELDTISRRLESLYPAENKGIGVRALEGKDYFTPRIRTVVIGLWISVGLVLLIACANVANLLLGRAIVRAREISIRMAMGAGRWRVIRQLLVESLILSVAGGVLGWLLAICGVRAFDAAIAGTGKPPWLDFSMDYTVFAYLSAISIGAGILFGLLPALRLSKIDVHSSLKDGGHGAHGGSRGRHLSGLLVVSEMTMAVMLLVGTALVVKTLVSLNRSRIGVNTANLLTMNLDLPTKKYSSPTDLLSFYEQLQSRIHALPGIEAVSMASSLPGHGGTAFFYELDDTLPFEQGSRPQVRGLVVAPRYFHVMDIPPVVGREFMNSESVPVVIVNRSFAAQHWSDRSPVGRRLRIVQAGVPQPWLQVVGVVPDVWQNDMIQREYQPLIYLPYAQKPLQSMFVVARTSVPPATMGQTFRRSVQAMDENLPVFALRTLDGDIEQHDWAIRVFGAVFTIFSVIAMALASVGLYAVVAHSVSQRTQEIGVRLALGARPANMVGSVFAQAMRQVALGLGAGLLAAFVLTRVLRATLAGLFQPDPATYIIVVLVLLVAGMLACSIPALRASRVDPVVALRFE